MRILSLFTLLLFVSCKQDNPPATPEPASNEHVAPSPQPNPPPKDYVDFRVNEPTEFFPGFGVVLFGNSILVDTNSLRYPIVGQAKMLNQYLAIAKVDTNSLRQEWFDLIGKSFTIYTPNGEDRRVTVKSFKLVSIASDGEDGFREILEAHPDHKLSEDEFRNLSAACVLVAVFDAFDTTMSGPDLQFHGEQPVWARLSKLGHPHLSESLDEFPGSESSIDTFIRGSDPYSRIQSAYKTYTESHSSSDEGIEQFPESWMEYAPTERSFFQLGEQEIGFVSMKSRDNCGGPGFRAELNTLHGAKPFRFADLGDLPYTSLGQHKLLYAWDNESKGNLDLLFTDSDEILTFVRIYPDATTQSFSLRIPLHAPKC
ncbi:MAG: hypothetical protein IPK50_14390 [Fibrobacterota bacterium]|nr:MAG: hypothetical protein IPK50_14390 [Fibrobacterota bacterium]